MSTETANKNDVVIGKTVMKRLMKDLKILDKAQTTGIQAAPLEDNLLLWHASVTILNGKYQGGRVHLIIKIPDNYPFEPPLTYVAFDQGFTREFHSHLYNTGSEYGLSVCNDMTANFHSHFRDKVGYGWSPGSTLEDLLLNMQVFLADPDFAKPTDEQIVEMIEKTNQYQCPLCNLGNVGKPKTPQHSQHSQHPQHQSESEPTESGSGGESSGPIAKLTCSITKETYASNDNIILGYPLLITKDRFDRMHITPVLELISYDAFITEIQKESGKLDNYEGVKFRSATGHYYNHWLPIYLNKEHFERSRTTIQNALTVIRYGVEGIEENDFKPEVVLQVLPTLLNKTILALVKKDIHGSTSAIEAYTQFLHLFMAYLELYPDLFDKINQEVKEFRFDPYCRHKKCVPDLGEFIIKLFLSDYSYDDTKLKRVLVEEHFARGMHWIYKDEPTYRDTPITKELLPRLFELKEISCKMLAFNLKAAEYFVKVDAKKKLDENYGYPTEKIVLDFQKEINVIEEIADYSTFLKLVRWNSIIRGTNSLCVRFNEAKKLSDEQGYTKPPRRENDWNRIRDRRGVNAWQKPLPIVNKRSTFSAVSPFRSTRSISLRNRHNGANSVGRGYEVGVSGGWGSANIVGAGAWGAQPDDTVELDRLGGWEATDHTSRAASEPERADVAQERGVSVGED